MCPVMSWLLCLSLWVSVTAIQLCQATFYETIQQTHGTRPGRTTIHMIGESRLVLPAPAALVSSIELCIDLNPNVLLPLVLDVIANVLNRVAAKWSERKKKKDNKVRVQLWVFISPCCYVH